MRIFLLSLPLLACTVKTLVRKEDPDVVVRIIDPPQGHVSPAEHDHDAHHEDHEDHHGDHGHGEHGEHGDHGAHEGHGHDSHGHHAPDDKTLTASYMLIGGVTLVMAMFYLVQHPAAWLCGIF